MASPWGAALESLGSGLMKFGLAKMDEEQDLAKETRAEARLLAAEDRAHARALDLEKQKEDMKAAREAAVQNARGEVIAAARVGAAADLTAQGQNRAGLLELARIKGATDKAWENAAPTAPTIRTTTTEDDAFIDMQQADRDIYARNLQENLAYVQSLKPSQKAIDLRTLEKLQERDPEVAKEFAAQWRTREEVARLARGEAPTVDTKYIQGLGVVQTDSFGKVTVLVPDSKVRGADAAAKGTDKPSAAEKKADAAAQKLRNQRVRRGTVDDWLTMAEYRELAGWVSKKVPEGEDPLQNAPKWVSGLINQAGGVDAMRQLMKDAASSPIKPWYHDALAAPAATTAGGSPQASFDAAKARLDAALRAGSIDSAKYAQAMRELEAEMRKMK